VAEFTKGTHRRFDTQVSTIDFTTVEDRDRVFRLLELFEKLVEEADNAGYAIEFLGEKGTEGLKVAVLDLPHAKALASVLRGSPSERSGVIPLDQTWDREDLHAVAAQMRGLKEKLQRKEGD